MYHSSGESQTQSSSSTAPRHIHHSHLNKLIWRTIKKAQIPATKVPVGLSRTDGKKPDQAILIPWKRGKPLTWDATISNTYVQSQIGETAENAGTAATKVARDITISDTYAQSHIGVTAENAGAAAMKAAKHMTVPDTYAQSHIGETAKNA